MQRAQGSSCGGNAYGSARCHKCRNPYLRIKNRNLNVKKIARLHVPKTGIPLQIPREQAMELRRTARWLQKGGPGSECASTGQRQTLCE